MHDIFCVECTQTFKAKRSDKRYCSAGCQSRAGRLRRGEQTDVTKNGRNCGICGSHFSIQPPNSNQRYCSQTCATSAAKTQRKAFHKQKPGKQREYNSRRPYRDIRLERLKRRYPDLPTSCEACGENRVVEIAHKPGFERNGAWRLMSNSKRNMIWILCPTCHKLIDKHICTPTQLGLG